MGGTNWIDDAVQRTKEKYQVQRALEDKLIQEEGLKAKLGSRYCRELFAWFESVEVSFNSKFGSQVLAVSVVGTEGSRSVQVLARPIRAQERIADLNYQENTRCIGLSMGSGATSETQLIKLVLSADGVILAEIGAKYYTPEQLGQKIIDDLLA
jgi:hypothetical protein